MPGGLRFKDLMVYEDDDLIVINKPAGISALHERSGEGQSIIELAKGWNQDLQLCHRIDKETSGALLIAKHPESYRGLNLLFEQRKVQKEYQALVWGSTPGETFECSLPIAATSRGLAKIDRRSGKDSLTRFKVLHQYRSSAHIQANPVTGRLHQIRVHCAALEIPIMGDVSYHGDFPYLYRFKKKYKLSDSSDRPMISRLALHASAIGFTWKDKVYHIEIPLPDDMQVLNKLLSKYDL